jgi:hypothetical protein
MGGAGVSVPPVIALSGEERAGNNSCRATSVALARFFCGQGVSLREWKIDNGHWKMKRVSRMASKTRHYPFSIFHYPFAHSAFAIRFLLIPVFGA